MSLETVTKDEQKSKEEVVLSSELSTLLDTWKRSVEYASHRRAYLDHQRNQGIIGYYTLAYLQRERQG